MEVILGAATGYVTNDIALKQLFREGGIVEKERDAFTAMLIAMMQEEILQEESLAELADDPAVMGFFDDLTESLFHRILPDLLEKEEEDLTQAKVLGLDILKAQLDAWEIEDLAFDCRRILHRLETFLGQDLAPALVETSLQDWGLEAPLRRAWAEITGWREGKDLPEESKILLRELLKPAIFYLMDRMSQPGTCRDLIKSVCPDFQGRIEMNHLLSLLGQHIGCHHQLIKSLGLSYEKELKEALAKLIEVGMTLLLSLLTPYKKELVSCIFRSLESGTGNVPKPLRKAVFKLAQNKLDPDGPFLEKVEADLSGPDFARQMADKVWVQLSEQMQEMNNKLHQGQEPGALVLEIWLKVPESIRLQVEERCHRMIDGRLIAFEDGEIPSGLWIERILSSLGTYLIDQEGGRAIDAKLTRLVQTPMASLLGKDTGQFLVQAYHAYGQDYLTRILTKPIQSDRLKALGHLILDRLYDHPIQEIYGDFLASLERLPVEGASLEKGFSDFVRLQGFDVLPGFLGRITQEQLDALSRSEVRELVLDLLGREMKPLSYFGAFVGALAGGATGVALTLSGTFPDPRLGAEAAGLFASRSLLYGSVGYGTNVLAVRGLFRPYKERMGWQGLLPKNKSRLSRRMVKMADTYVLNDEIWQSFGLRAKARWQGHRESLAERFLTQERCEVLAAASLHLWPQITNDRVFGLLSRHTDHPSFRKVFKKGSHDLLEAFLRAQLTKNHRDKIADLFQDPYVQTFVKSILTTLLSDPYLQRALLSWGAKIPLLKPQSAQSLGHTLGRPFFDYGLTFLGRNQEKITQILADRIYQELSSLQQIAFALGDGEKYVRRLVENLIGKELRDFVDLHERELVDGLTRGLQETGGQISLGDLGLERIVKIGSAYLGQSSILDPGSSCWHGMGGYVAGLVSDLQTQGLLGLERERSSWLDRFFEQSGLGYEDFADLRESVRITLRETESVAYFRRQPVVNWLTPKSIDSILYSVADLCRLPQDILQGSAKEAFLLAGDIIYPAVIDFILEDGAGWVSLLDLPKIIANRIDSLDPRELECLIRKIANPYFHHVERMGWLGGLVAVPATILATSLQ